ALDDVARERGVTAFELIAAQREDRDRHVLRIFLALAGVDDDFLENVAARGRRIRFTGFLRHRPTTQGREHCERDEWRARVHAMRVSESTHETSLPVCAREGGSKN